MYLVLLIAVLMWLVGCYLGVLVLIYCWWYCWCVACLDIVFFVLCYLIFVLLYWLGWLV